MRWISRAVTLIVVGTVLVLGFALLRANMPKTHVGGRLAVFARFRDGSRIALGSPVMIAGVRIGEVAKLTIEGDFARVDLVLADDSDIPVDSWITKRAESAFGDDFLEIIPSGGEEGAATTRRLKSGDQIVHVIEGGSTDTALRAIARTMPKADQGLDTIHDGALEGRKWVEGRLEGTLARADRWLADGHIDQPIESADRAMARLESGTTRAADAVASAKPKVASTLDRFDDGIRRARTRMADVKSSLHDGLANARDGMDRVDQPIAQIRDVVEAIDEGRGDDYKGKLGRLVNNGDVADTIEDGTAAVEGFTHNLNAFRSWVGFRTEWSFLAGQPTFYVTAELQARHNSFYLIELAKTAQGGIASDQISEVVNAQDYNRTTTIEEQLRFTVQFGHRFGQHIQIRGGLKESEFGVGADLLLNNGALKFSADLFGASLSSTPDLKLTAAYEVVHSLYILGGITDALDKSGTLNIENGNLAQPTYLNQLRYGRDVFLGVNLQFTDADLASLARIYGAMLIGLAI